MVLPKISTLFLFLSGLMIFIFPFIQKTWGKLSQLVYFLGLNKWQRKFLSSSSSLIASNSHSGARVYLQMLDGAIRALEAWAW